MILDYVASTPKISNIINDKVKRISKSNVEFNSYLLACDFQKNSRTLFVVLPTLFDAQKYYDNISRLLGDVVLFYPVDEMVISNLLISSAEFKLERLNTLIRLLDGNKHIVVTNINGALRVNHSKIDFNNFIYELKKGESYNIADIRKRLISYGYTCVNNVSKPGEFCYRGSIIDFYPILEDSPIRLDFFDDELETIKMFSPETQLSFGYKENVLLTPFVELIYTDSEKETYINTLENLKKNASELEEVEIEKVISNFDLRNDVDTLINYSSIIKEPSCILDYDNNAKIYIVNEDKIESIYSQIERQTLEYNKENDFKVLDQYKMFLPYETLNGRNVTYIDTLVEHKGDYEISAENVAPFYGSLEAILRSITPHLNKGYVFLNLPNGERLRRLKDFFLENLIKYRTVSEIKMADKSCINIIDEEGVLTLSIPEDDVYILSEETLYNSNTQVKKITYKSTFGSGEKINEYKELVPGDYIVHINYGIGQYEGIKTLDLKGLKEDCLSIEYAGGDHLYIPVGQLSMIKKYIGRESLTPKLTKLGSTTWENTKAKVKKRVLELGEKLVKLYSEREASSGFSCGVDTADQAIFESEFEFEETPDQKRAIEAVKRDMESTRPMDRLICGDVGYGKTEIALRAAFKAIENGKQVCYLAPTTILTRQHYHTFKKRMEAFGIRVELLNRFTGIKQTRKILHDLAFGTVDVVIGTHRLLSDDVKFKDLGLLITDEEQRFGVMHKEKIKEMKINVDSIMLTATPIPRTLQMSLIGIKELSLIETPPKNRYPVQTYVTPRHDSLIKEAIERELLRDGQVFYLYNYVENIADKAYEISKLVPEARVCYAHGKMNKNELEDIIQDFIDKKYNVLVSTTIIETGIDIPEANTLIIHDSDRLGLSQLYQIRGRVGRSDKIAYAYLMYEPRKVLTPQSEARLEAIKEFTELGSGFKIAMRDLSIRGAGDLLGPEQSGFIDSVGLDTYMEILDETIKELKGEKKEKHAPLNASFPEVADHYIPANYEVNESLKIDIHKKVNTIHSLEDFDKVHKELEDRFGKIDKDLEAYMYEKLLYSLCIKAHIENLDIKPLYVKMNISSEATKNANGEQIFKEAYKRSNNFTLSYKDYKINITYRFDSLGDKSWIKVVCGFLQAISK